MTNKHSFHIPVMGLGFTIDTPLKVAKYGIDSVIALADDTLIERMRKMYCEKFRFPYEEITKQHDDFRAKRITSYLNLVSRLVTDQIEEFVTTAFNKQGLIQQHISMLPDSEAIQKKFDDFLATFPSVDEVREWVIQNLKMGNIEANIMTKLDRENFKGEEKLPTQYNDAHAALRGFANSDLQSSIVLSAGMNPRLYSYIENFEDFYPNENGELKKKITLKVSDYRSALIQGKFLAKKGLWVSEFRIESGLNCGGHAFATEGYLMGPILEEFKNKREELTQTLHPIFVDALTKKSKVTSFTIPQPIKITAQGGVGTVEEHQFLLEHYQIDSVGWGTPFLLVPEAISIDETTLNKLAAAKEEDLYLSNISPLGVPFNSLKGSTKELEKQTLVGEGKIGSPCKKKYLALTKEFSNNTICTASHKYQLLKIKELKGKEISEQAYQNGFEQIVEKECLCTGLAASALLVNNITAKTDDRGVTVCPGPNMAYFSKEMSLNEIINHIYGRVNMISRTDRPNMFVKELNIYLDYLEKHILQLPINISKKQKLYVTNFAKNLASGITYYRQLFMATQPNIIKGLTDSENALQLLLGKIENLKSIS